MTAAYMASGRVMRLQPLQKTALPAMTNAKNSMSLAATLKWKQWKAIRTQRREGFNRLHSSFVPWVFECASCHHFSFHSLLVADDFHIRFSSYVAVEAQAPHGI
eukprot:6460122-Amphidinium_carterae.1